MGRYVKYDMHCHTSEGSVDSSVSIFDYIEKLKRCGFSGMVVTDHDSYKGYEAYKRESYKVKDFVVLRGIEYDTYEYGHIIVIMPKETPKEVYDLLEIRGLSLGKLIDVVHDFGGILGPAHPGGEPFLSFANTRYWVNESRARYLSLFDFIEGYNSCETPSNTRIAIHLAKENNLPLSAGSDSHKVACVGRGFTLLPQSIKDENDLIEYYKSGESPRIGGRSYRKTTKDKMGPFNRLLVVGFFLMNKALAFKNAIKREKQYEKVIYIKNKYLETK